MSVVMNQEKEEKMARITYLRQDRFSREYKNRRTQFRILFAQDRFKQT